MKKIISTYKPTTYMLTATEILYKQFKGNKNWVTPNLIKTGLIKDNMVFELSGGKFMGEPIFGVSIVEYNPKTGETELLDNLGKTFDSVKEAKEYIDSLIKENNTIAGIDFTDTLNDLNNL